MSYNIPLMLRSGKRTLLSRWQNWGDSAGHMFLKLLRVYNPSCGCRINFCWKKKRKGPFCSISTSPQLWQKRRQEKVSSLPESPAGPLLSCVSVTLFPFWWEWGTGLWGLILYEGVGKWEQRRHFFFKFYWGVVDLQGCINFRHPARWFSYRCIVIFFFILISIAGYYGILNRVLCAIQQILVDYLFLYVLVCIC